MMNKEISEISLITYLRTYSRKIKENINKTESWDMCVDRIIQACDKQLKINFTDNEISKLQQFMKLEKLKCCPAGRFLWQLGTKTVDKHGFISLQNCAFVNINSPIEPLLTIMNYLMLGVGVGFKITNDIIKDLPIIKPVKIIRKDVSDADFIVPDSREGWIELLERTLKAHFITGKSFIYSCQLIRSKGAPIKTFGGISSGPEILCDGIDKINKILNDNSGLHPSSVVMLDIACIIGKIVVSGNVRRSALLAIGDQNDTEYLRAKRWDLGNLPNWRSNSNNSIVCNNINDILDHEEFWNGYKGNGEPYGLINLELSKRCGRTGDLEHNDPNVEGYNPCAEQSLEDNETCCLGELFLPNIDTYEELIDCITLIYKICKHSMTLHCDINKKTEKIVHKNMRMGIGITGYLQSEEYKKKWLKPAYEFLRDYDNTYSEYMNFNKSIKLTTCKPSGTLSLLGNVTSGIHPGYSEFYIRRIRFSSSSPLIEILKSRGYEVEYQLKFNKEKDYDTQIVSFPCKFPNHTIFAKDCTAIQQMEHVKRLQSEWSDNSVSCTVYYKLEELEDIKKWLKENYNDNIKTISFLLHSEHGFAQAPLEEITEKKYHEMMSKITPITQKDLGDIVYFEEKDEYIQDDCSKGCPIK